MTNEHRDPSGIDELGPEDYALPSNYAKVRAQRDRDNANGLLWFATLVRDLLDTYPDGRHINWEKIREDATRVVAEAGAKLVLG